MPDPAAERKPDEITVTPAMIQAGHAAIHGSIYYAGHQILAAVYRAMERARRAETTERQKMVGELYQGGETLTVIGKRFGISKQAVHHTLLKFEAKTGSSLPRTRKRPNP